MWGGWFFQTACRSIIMEQAFELYETSTANEVMIYRGNNHCDFFVVTFCCRRDRVGRLSLRIHLLSLSSQSKMIEEKSVDTVKQHHEFL